MPPQKWRAGVVAPYEVGWQLPFLLLFSSWAAGTLTSRTLRAQRALICGSKCRESSGRCLPACSHPKGNGVIRKRGETLCLPSCVPAAHSREYAVMIWHTRRAEVVAPYEIPRQFTCSRPARYKAAYRTVKSTPVMRGHPVCHIWRIFSPHRGTTCAASSRLFSPQR